MKKIIIALLALCIAISMALPASAITTGKWDWDAAQASINAAASDLVAQQQPTEPTEEPAQAPAADELPDWLARWLAWWDTVRN